MNPIRRGPVPVAAILAVQLALAGCAHRLERTLLPREEASRLDRDSHFLKAHMLDGDLYVLTGWQVDGRAGVVVGSGDHYDPQRRLVARGGFRLPIRSVALFETNVEKVHPAIAAMTVVTGLSLALTVACVSNPKACFGSCPTVYVHDGRTTPAAEAFSASIAPALEAGDIDALFGARVRGPDVDLELTNEAFETHVIRRLDLLAARRPPGGGRVVATRGGTLFEARSLAPPAACRAPEGDCTSAVSRFDARERWSTTDGHDLAAHEVIDLAFDPPAGGDRIGLVIGARQTLVTTFLLYQFLSYFGSESPALLASLSRRGAAAGGFSAAGLHQLLGGIDVQVEDGAGGFRTVGRFDETGPIATDVQVVPLPPGALAGHIRLRMARGDWRIDYVALARLGRQVTPVRLRPEQVTRAGHLDPAALAGLRDPGRTLVTRPGDHARIRYRLPAALAAAPGRVDLFLDARGYYLEWIRTRWLDQENLALGLYLLARPAAALRRLAPAFKKVEPKMESMFWSSRYAPAR